MPIIINIIHSQKIFRNREYSLRIYLILSLITLFAILTPAQEVVRVVRGYVALQNENVGIPDEELLIRRVINGKTVDVGRIRVLVSRNGKTAARIIREYGSYHIQPGDFALRIPESTRQSDVTARVKSWHFLFQAGPGFRIGDFKQNIPPGLHDYHQHLKTGMALSAEISYFHSRAAGIGWIINQWWKKHQADNQIIYQNDTGLPVDQADLENNITLFYTGPALFIRQPISRSDFFLSALMTAGLYHFQDILRVNPHIIGSSAISEERLSGKTLGLGGKIGIEYMFNSGYGMFVSLFYLFGILPKPETDSNLYQDRISLNRLDIHAGVVVVF
jgi:hypothetical protein